MTLRPDPLDTLHPAGLTSALPPTRNSTAIQVIAEPVATQHHVQNQLCVALVTYGVQGATLDEAHYHPGDESRFEEGYVALTRDRHRTRIYVVDGHILGGDVAHGGHEAERSGLDTVAAALEQRRSRTLAHEADAHAAARAGDRGRDLRSLRLEREHLESVLSAAPSSPADTLMAARRHRDALLARRQLWETRLAEAEHAASVPKRRRSGPPRDLAAAKREIGAADRALAGIGQRIAHHEDRQGTRAAFLAEHADDVERLDLMRQAEAAREVQVRTAALDAVPDDVVEILGAEPSARSEHLAWEAAVADVAVFRERYGMEAGDGAPDGATQPLGPPPSAPAARRSWDHTMTLIQQARGVAEPPCPAPDIAVM